MKNILDIKAASAASVLFLCCAVCRAQEAPLAGSGGSQEAGASADNSDGGAPSFDFTAKQTLTSGSQKYRYSGTSLDLETKAGLDLNAGGSVYSSETSSRTSTVDFGLSRQWETILLGGGYSNTGLVNDLKSRSLDITISARTDSKDFRTTAGVDMLFTQNTLYLSGAKKLTALGIGQKTETFKLKQRVYGFKATAEYSKNSYDKNPDTISAKLSKRPKRFAGALGQLSGMVSGFPDWSTKFGLYQDLPWFPVTVWSSYQNIHMLNTTFGRGVTADSLFAGADLDVLKWLTISPEYNHLRQTGQPVAAYYTLAITAVF